MADHGDPMLPRIRCAVCDKPADRVVLHFDPDSRNRTLTVRCHGYVDRMTISDRDIRNWSDEERRQWERIERGEVEGLAFTTKRIGGAS